MFILDLRKEPFNSEGDKAVKQLPRELLDDPSLKLFKARLDQALSNLIYWNVSQPMAVGVGTR